jgi:endonuclease YncB( thermonuclease family)
MIKKLLRLLPIKKFKYAYVGGIGVLLFLASLSFFFRKESNTYAYVYEVVDGDTVWVRSGKDITKLRLIEIDSPESNQPYGYEAYIYLSNLVQKKIISYTNEGIDKYGRTLATVYLDKLNVNEKMIQTGNAWYYNDYPENIKYWYLEKAARIFKKGLWKYPSVSPESWRKLSK